ncbi:MAG: amidohydrolase [Candidatus Verstraetearchaeota archaeon]|nr:amidohydrolase [Candidatus Verstraetearchaeota archaeon]
MEYIIVSKSIVTMGRRGILKDGAIVTEDDRIIDIGRIEEMKRKYPRYEKIDASNCILLPGLINTHTHIAMSLLRGYADDLKLHEWLNNWIWPLEKEMTDRDIYVGGLLAAIEALRMGTTTINTMYHHHPEYNEVRAIYETGMRGVASHTCFSWRIEEDYKMLEDLIRKWHGKGSWRIRAAVSPHAPYTVSPKHLKELKEYVDAKNMEVEADYEKLIWHIHTAETKNEPEMIKEKFNVDVSGGVLKYLYDLKVLGEEVLAAHCVWLTEEDVEVMKKTRTKVSHNPISNLKLASGISPIYKLIDAGITVSLGTDSACSNNALDMFETMKAAALIQKGLTMNPTVISADEALKMATVKGAEALNWSSQIGRLEIGMKADIIAVELDKPHLTPLYNEISHIVYAAKGLDVKHVMVDGKIIMENYKIKTVDEEEIMKEAEKTKEKLLEKVKR